MVDTIYSHLESEIKKLSINSDVPASDDQSQDARIIYYENLLLEDHLQRFLDESYPECDLFTKLESTTCTIEGNITNMKFFEEQLIKVLEPTYQIPMLTCNYGEKMHESYEVVVPPKKSTRGRKKMVKAGKKPRKMQGNGKQFGSQLTHVVRTQREDGLEIYPKNKKYRFKVFRNGKLQLPGAKPILIRDIIVCIHFITDLLTPHKFDPAGPNPTIELIRPVMKNYKYRLKIEPGQLINLTLFKKLLLDMNNPFIFDVKYDRSVTRLSIDFNTPLSYQRNKKTKVNLFMRGKINILGAIDFVKTREICDFIRTFMYANISELIINPL